MQALIARVLVMFSKDTNDAKAKEVWACVTRTSVVGRILTRGEVLEAMEDLLRETEKHAKIDLRDSLYTPEEI